MLAVEVRMQLSGKSALVTGASRGLGAALAAELARRGARVVAVARGAEALETTVRAFVERVGSPRARRGPGDRDAVYPLIGAATALWADRRWC
jgi:NAD(P)-dependent dehydrogenase (short-subunit alcohol dehydrogenase family)